MQLRTTVLWNCIYIYIYMTKISMECFSRFFLLDYPAGDDAGSFAFRFGTLHGFRLCLKNRAPAFFNVPPCASTRPKVRYGRFMRPQKNQREVRMLKKKWVILSCNCWNIVILNVDVDKFCISWNFWLSGTMIASLYIHVGHSCYSRKPYQKMYWYIQYLYIYNIYIYTHAPHM